MTAITSNLKQVREALQRANKDIDEGARNARDEMMTTLIQLSKEQIVGRRPKGQKAVSGQPPMNRTGNLRRSIRGQKYNVGFAKYEAIVGPSMEYARAVEFGGSFAPESWHGTSAMKGFPYMRPAYKQFVAQVPAILKKHFKLDGK